MPPPQTTPSPTSAPTKGQNPHNPHLSWTTYSVSTTSTHGEGWVTLKPWPRPTPHAELPSHEQPEEAFQRPEAEVQEILDIVHGEDDANHGKHKMSWTTFSVSTTATTHGEGWVTLTPWPRPTKHASTEEMEGGEERVRVLYEHDVSTLPSSSSRMMVGGGRESGCAHLSVLLHVLGIVVFVGVVARVLRASRQRRERGRIVLRDEEERERGEEKV